MPTRHAKVNLLLYAFLQLSPEDGILPHNRLIVNGRDTSTWMERRDGSLAASGKKAEVDTPTSEEKKEGGSATTSPRAKTKRRPPLGGTTVPNGWYYI
jgi:hypothetical protein